MNREVQMSPKQKNKVKEKSTTPTLPLHFLKRFCRSEGRHCLPWEQHFWNFNVHRLLPLWVAFFINHFSSVCYAQCWEKNVFFFSDNYFFVIPKATISKHSSDSNNDSNKGSDRDSDNSNDHDENEKKKYLNSYCAAKPAPGTKQSYN